MCVFPFPRLKDLPCSRRVCLPLMARAIFPSLPLPKGRRPSTRKPLPRSPPGGTRGDEPRAAETRLPEAGCDFTECFIREVRWVGYFRYDSSSS